MVAAWVTITAECRTVPSRSALTQRDRQRGVASEVLSYASERTLQLALTAVMGILVARYLGPSRLGLLNYVSAIFGMLAPLSLLGMQAILVRDFSTTHAWKQVMASALGLQVPIALVASILGLLLVGGTRGFEGDALAVAVAVVPLPLLALSGTFRSYLEATGDVRRIVMTGIVATFASFAFKALALLLQAPIWAFALAGTIEAAVVYLGLAKGGGATFDGVRIRQFYRSDIARDLLRHSWPLMLSGFAVTIYMKVDILMLGILANDTVTGWYVAAARLSEVWYVLPMAALAAIRPRLARLYASHAQSAYNTGTQRFMSTSLAVGFGAVVLTFTFSEPLVNLLYGPGFAPAAAILQLHIFATPFMFLGLAASQWFVDRGLTRFMMIRSIAGATTNVMLNLLLIPLIGAIGAAIATIVAYAVSGLFMNAIQTSTRPVFRMQLRALRMAHR